MKNTQKMFQDGTKIGPRSPQDDPKSIKNRLQKMIKILIDFKTASTRFLGSTGGMRDPPGGTLGRSKNSAKEDLQ